MLQLDDHAWLEWTHWVYYVDLAQPGQPMCLELEDNQVKFGLNPVAGLITQFLKFPNSGTFRLHLNMLLVEKFNGNSRQCFSDNFLGRVKTSTTSICKVMAPHSVK